jgi:predicted acyl esterase
MVIAAFPAHARPLVEHVSVPMSDGTLLNTTVYLPVDMTGPYPALLIRTPYGIAEGGVQGLTEYGFAVVFQDVRGRFGSGGEFHMFRDDGWGPDNADGIDTVSWILEQSWCSGSIVTSGSEAIGLTQNLLAAASPPALRAQVIATAPTKLVEDFIYPGGALRFGDVSGFLSRLNTPTLLDTLLAHPPHDPWWKWTDARARLGMTSVPTYRITGWYDPNLSGAVRAFAAVREAGTAQKLVIGPWTTRVGDPVVGERVFGAASLADSEVLVGGSWEWLMALGRGLDSSIFSKPEVAYYVMGADEPGAPGNEWRVSASWPPATREIALFLHPDGALAEAPPHAADAFREFHYDPLDPVSTLGGANLVGGAGSWDQRPVESRDDVLVFTTAPLESPLTVVGSVVLALHAGSDAPDTDFTAKLTDIYPDGRSMLICDGIVRASQAHGGRNVKPLEPDEVRTYEVELGQTAMTFAAGHRVRIAVSSSNYPRFHPNPNTGDPFARTGAPRVATNRVYTSAAHPTALILPVLNDSATHAVIGREAPPVAAPGVRKAAPHAVSARVGHVAHDNSIRAEASFRRTGEVRVRVLDEHGRSVRVLHTGRQPRGSATYRWDGRHQSGRMASGGTYTLEIQFDGAVFASAFSWAP